MRCAVFDLDGTLADTSGAMIAAAAACLPRGALDGIDGRGAALGGGGMALLRAGLAAAGHAPEGAAARYPAFLAAYAEGLRTGPAPTLFPGAEAALARLAAAGWRLALCTNKRAELALLWLARAGLAQRFAAVVGAGTLAVRKPDPAPLLAAIARAGGRPARAVLVGDSATDAACARAAGVALALVPFGAAGPAGAAALAPDALVPDFAALDAALAALV